MSDVNQNESPIIQICGLWLNDAKDGSKYMKGRLGNVDILIFKNRNKTAENHPDYQLCLARHIKKETAEGSTEAEDLPDEVPF